MIILENGKVMGCTQNVYDLPVYCKDCELKNTVSCTLSMYEDFELKLLETLLQKNSCNTVIRLEMQERS
jgi:hypothetical protein